MARLAEELINKDQFEKAEEIWIWQWKKCQ